MKSFAYTGLLMNNFTARNNSSIVQIWEIHNIVIQNTVTVQNSKSKLTIAKKKLCSSRSLLLTTIFVYFRLDPLKCQWKLFFFVCANLTTKTGEEYALQKVRFRLWSIIMNFCSKAFFSSKYTWIYDFSASTYIE